MKLAELTEDERDFYEERAAIAQWMGGLPQKRAEAEAMKRVLERRRRLQNPPAVS